MIKEFLTKKALEWKLRNAPKEQREQVVAFMEKDPELFTRIARDIKTEMKKGKSEQAAAMSVMPKYQQELRTTLGTTRVPQRFTARGAIRK